MRLGIGYTLHSSGRNKMFTRVHGFIDKVFYSSVQGLKLSENYCIDLYYYVLVKENLKRSHQPGIWSGGTLKFVVCDSTHIWQQDRCRSSISVMTTRYSFPPIYPLNISWLVTCPLNPYWLTDCPLHWLAAWYFKSNMIGWLSPTSILIGCLSPKSILIGYLSPKPILIGYLSPIQFWLAACPISLSWWAAWYFKSFFIGGLFPTFF